MIFFLIQPHQPGSEITALPVSDQDWVIPCRNAANTPVVTPAVALSDAALSLVPSRGRCVPIAGDWAMHVPLSLPNPGEP
jgi:hypothetical protein